jgi:hypothetical protein
MENIRKMMHMAAAILITLGAAGLVGAAMFTGQILYAPEQAPIIGHMLHAPNHNETLLSLTLGHDKFAITASPAATKVLTVITALAIVSTTVTISRASTRAGIMLLDATNHVPLSNPDLRTATTIHRAPTASAQQPTDTPLQKILALARKYAAPTVDSNPSK